MQKAKYKTEPLKIWGRAKQLRNKFFQDYVDIKKGGGLRIVAGTGISLTFSAGFGEDAIIMGYEPLAANIAHNADFSLKCLEASEKIGLGRELCGYAKNVVGSMLLNKFNMPDGTILDSFPIPDILVFFSLAPCHNKWPQFMGELKDIPFYLIDLPKVFPLNTESMLKYVSDQVLDYIKWAEDITKRKFNDELFIQAAFNEMRSFRLWTKIMLLNQNIPAPLEEKTIFSLFEPNMTQPYREETVDFYTQLLEEVEDRVKRGIAAVPYEQLRIITDPIPPWPYLSLWRYIEKEYGVVSVGSPYAIALAGSWKLDEEGNFVPTPTPEELGMKITNREEAVRALVWYKTHFATETIYTIAGARVHHHVMAAIGKQWKADAAILHLNRGCTMQALGGIEARNALVEAGIPTIMYEGNNADPRDLNISLAKRQIDIFLESLGVKKLSG